MAALVLFGAGAARADDEICARIEAFHAAPVSAADHARWVDVLWAAPEELAVGCARRSDDPPSLVLCDWLTGHTSAEFPESLPKRILQCFGQVAPDTAGYWSEGRRTFDLRPGEGGLRLDVDLTDAMDMPVVRLTSFAPGRSAANVTLPSLSRRSD